MARDTMSKDTLGKLVSYFSEPKKVKKILKKTRHRWDNGNICKYCGLKKKLVTGGSSPGTYYLDYFSYENEHDEKVTVKAWTQKNPGCLKEPEYSKKVKSTKIEEIEI